MRESSKRQSTLVRYLNCPEPMSRMMEKSHANRAEAARVDGGTRMARSLHQMHFLSPCRGVPQLA